MEDVDGHHPALPWRLDDIGLVLAALDRLADALTPAPVTLPTIAEKYSADFTGWRILSKAPNDDRLDPWSCRHIEQLAALETTWAAHASGDTLLHTDVRADNLLLTDGGVVVIDWPHACRGAAFVEPVIMAPCVAMQTNIESFSMPRAGAGLGRAPGITLSARLTLGLRAEAGSSNVDVVAGGVTAAPLPVVHDCPGGYNDNRDGKS